MNVIGEAQEFGPGAGGVYTDKDTITLVQKALKTLGYDLVVDGIWGPKTQAALKKATGHDGPPDDKTLVKLNQLASAMVHTTGQNAGGFTSVAPQAPPSSPSSLAAGFWGKPLYEGSPVKRWQAAVIGGASFTMLVGIILAARRK